MIRPIRSVTRAFTLFAATSVRNKTRQLSRKTMQPGLTLRHSLTDFPVRSSYLQATHRNGAI